MFGKDVDKINDRINSLEKTTLKLSDEIGKMADRIGDMSIHIGEMSDRILETQKFQGKNIELMHESIKEAMKMVGKQMETTNKILEFLVNKGTDVDSPKLENG